MSEYADRFAENRIDLSVLPDLTDQHLKHLGIPLGDRLKMPVPFWHRRSLRLASRSRTTPPSVAKSQ
jgi:hypothetical protein